MLIVIRAGWLVRACRRCSGSAQESRASLPECVGDACFTRSSGKTPEPIRKIQRTPISRSRSFAQTCPGDLVKMSLKTHHCSLSASMISFSSSGLTPIRAGADWILIKTPKFATSSQWEVKKLGTGQCKRSKTHTYWRFVLQMCKQNTVISKARLVYEKIFFFENPLWGWKIMLVMLHPCIFVLQ
jgi:hypothetical protein